MVSGFRYYLGFMVLFLSLLLVFFITLLYGSSGSGQVFEGWLGTARMAADEGMVPLRGWFYIVLGFLVMIHTVVSKGELVSRKALHAFDFYGGILVLVIWGFLPQLLALPCFSDEPSFRVYNFLGFVSYPSPIMIAGFIMVLGGMENRWRAWRNACLLAFVTAWMLMPVIRIVYPDLYFECYVGRALSFFGLVLVVSFVVRYVVLPYFASTAPRVEGFGPSITDIAARKGKTVQQILENGQEAPRRRFLFGVADEELVKKWGMIGQAILALSKSIYRKVAFVLLAMLAWPVFLFVVSGGHEGAYERDVSTMWETRKLVNGTVVSTREAMIAARRALNNEGQMIGLPRQEVMRKLRLDLMNPEYKFNTPPNVWQEDQFAVRIDDGKRYLLLLLVTDMGGKVAVSRVLEDDHPQQRVTPPVVY